MEHKINWSVKTNDVDYYVGTCGSADNSIVFETCRSRFVAIGFDGTFLGAYKTSSLQQAMQNCEDYLNARLKIEASI